MLYIDVIINHKNTPLESKISEGHFSKFYTPFWSSCFFHRHFDFVCIFVDFFLQDNYRRPTT